MPNNTKTMDKYKELFRAANQAAHVYHSVMSGPSCPESARAEAAAGLEFRMAQNALESFQAAHPELGDI